MDLKEARVTQELKGWASQDLREKKDPGAYQGWQVLRELEDLRDLLGLLGTWVLKERRGLQGHRGPWV